MTKPIEELREAWKAAQKRSDAAHAAWRDAFSESVVAYFALYEARKATEQTPDQIDEGEHRREEEE